MTILLLMFFHMTACSFNSNNQDNAGIVPDETTVTPTDIVIEQLEQEQELENVTYEKFDEKTDSVYNNAFEELVKPVEYTGEKPSLEERILRTGYGMYSTFRSLSPILFIASEVTGLLLFIFAKHNKQLKRLGLYGFMIGIPVLLVLIVFGIGFLNDMFLI